LAHASKPDAHEPVSELRKHYFLESYVLISPRRNLRPDSFAKNNLPHLIPSDNCPFDHLDGPGIWEYPRGGGWRVKVIPNKYPALTADNPKAYGVQEVIINTPRHDIEFSDLSVADIVEVFTAYRQRISELSKLEGIRYVLVFKNDGPVAGASVAHPHCQVFALPVIPRKLIMEADALNHYTQHKGTCAHCDLIGWEISQKVRVVAEDKHFIAIAPYASSHAFEVWLLPHRHINKLAELHANEVYSLATILKKITARLDSATISFNYFLQESLDGQDHHFHIKVEPRTTKFGGAELAVGIEINPMPPESAALWYNGRLQ
jgi:UDPglucose--hexose-1-phosphate uridylyltransferase